MDKEFQAAYAALNSEQKQAVDSIDGPLLVIAGPGTGKTQLLSTRVANILHKTDTDPGSILCLTFTNFAAINMQDRLRSLIGPTAHRVNVRTFHSFAADIMNNYSDYFWNGAELKIVPDTIQVEIVEDILSKLPLDNPLSIRFAGAFTATSDVLQALRLTKEAGLTPEKLKAMVTVNQAYCDVIETLLIDMLAPTLSIKRLDQLQEQIAELPDQHIEENVKPLSSLSGVIKESFNAAYQADISIGKTTETGKWKRRWIQTINGEKGMFDEKRRNAWWLSLTYVYEQYRTAMHEQGYYDYSDMIVEVITQLETHPDLLSQIQSSYEYVLIDEFQDTNAAQLRLSHLVVSHPVNEGKPNIMAVGDDDQSIFAFNGAELNNMLRFRENYRDTKTVILTNNYRSTQAILDTAQTIIEQADVRLVHFTQDIKKKLSAQNDLKNGLIARLNYSTKDQQLSDIALRIAEKWSNNKHESIAVLARNHESLRRLSAYLAPQNIPIQYEQQNDVMMLPLIQHINLIALTLIGIQEGDVTQVDTALAKLLTSPQWNVEPIKLWELAQSTRVSGDWLKTMHESKDTHLKRLASWFLWLSSEAAREPLAVIIEYILGLRESPDFVSPLYVSFVENKSITHDYLVGLSGLKKITNAISDMLGSASTIQTIKDYVRFIRLIDNQSKPLTDESWYVSGEHAVQLMTIHKAKGLEFDCVYIVDAVDRNWQPSKRGRKPPANLPLQPYGELYDDYVRLAYVAATRAKQSLIVSSYSGDEHGSEVRLSPLFVFIPETTSSPSISDEQKISILEESFSWPRLESKNETLLLKPRLEEYSLNATAFLQYLDVTGGGPTRFLEDQLLRLPHITTTSMAFGTAIHKALQSAQVRINNDSFTLKEVLSIFETTLSMQQLPTHEIERFTKHGIDVIKNLFGQLQFTLPIGGKPEQSFQHIRLHGARLSGTLDHVEEQEKLYIITDYKTGVPLPSFETKDRTKAIKAWRHLMQLHFYSILVRQSPTYKKPASIATRMIYVEAETKKELVLSTDIDESALQRTERLIQAVWNRIIKLDFPTTDSYPKTIHGIHAFENELLK